MLKLEPCRFPLASRLAWIGFCDIRIYFFTTMTRLFPLSSGNLLQTVFIALYEAESHSSAERIVRDEDAIPNSSFDGS